MKTFSKYKIKKQEREVSKAKSLLREKRQYLSQLYSKKIEVISNYKATGNEVHFENNMSDITLLRFEPFGRHTFECNCHQKDIPLMDEFDKQMTSIQMEMIEARNEIIKADLKIKREQHRLRKMKRYPAGLAKIESSMSFFLNETC